MGYFLFRYDSRVVIYERKMFIRLATGTPVLLSGLGKVGLVNVFVPMFTYFVF